MASRKSAGPSGGAVYRDLRKRLARGWAPGLTVLTGDDLFHLDAAQRALLAHLLPEDSSDLALTVFGEAKLDVAQPVAAARSLPMFAVSRVVLVREGAGLEGDESVLESYASAPPPRSHLLVRALKLDQRRTLHRVLSTAGTLLAFRSPSDPSSHEVQREVAALAAERTLELDGEVAGFLLDACGGDLYRVRSELDKIDAWLGSGPRAPVTIDLVREVGAGGGTLSGWEVADALLVRDRGAALAAARKLVTGGEEPIKIVGGLAWRARMLLQAKAMQQRGARANDVVAAARAWGYRDALLEGLRRYSLKELLAFPARILEADRSLKSRSLDPRAVLESLVEDLAGPAVPSGRAGAS